MRIYLNCTANLGDFVQSLPVLSGLKKSGHGPIEFVIRNEMSKFKGIKEFLMYQDIFESVEYDSDLFMQNPTILSSWTREDKNDPNRPIETCRYENWLKDNYKLDFEVDDDFEIKYPKLDLPIEQQCYYVGDRWSGPQIDDRRATGVLSNLGGYQDMAFLNYDDDLLTNCYYIKESTKPFITNFTGIGMIADLLNKETYVVWKAEDWNPEFRKGDDVTWDNGKGIQQVFEKHFYLNRKSKLVHATELKGLLRDN